MLSYWKTNLNVDDSWRRFTTNIGAISNDGRQQGGEFLGMGLIDRNIYSTPLSTVDFDKILKFLMKKGKMTQIVKMAKKNYSLVPIGNRGNTEAQFKKPISFLKKPLRGGKRTRRRYTNSNNYTIKKR